MRLCVFSSVSWCLFWGVEVEEEVEEGGGGDVTRMYDRIVI